jgi:hypothetical protein
MLSDKYGFPAIKTNQVRFTPETPWTTGQTVCVKVKTAISCSAVKLDPFTRRAFTIHIADDPWETGEILLPLALGKAQIWEFLQTQRPIPDISQFQIIAWRQDITKNDRWPGWQIDAIPHTFPVIWRVETPQETEGSMEEIQEKMTPPVTATEAWDILHTTASGLFEEANLDFRGKLRPGQK